MPTCSRWSASIRGRASRPADRSRGGERRSRRPRGRGGPVNPFLVGSDGTDPEQDSGVLEPEDTLEDLHGVRDVLDTGWSPPERPWAVTDWGTTEREELTGESLAGRLAREIPEQRGPAGDGLGRLEVSR